MIDAMIEIAKENSFTMDWMILRAIKVYVEEYRRRGSFRQAVTSCGCGSSRKIWKLCL